jgi:hypothetical protein
MLTKRWQRLGILASVVWVIVGGLLASWNELWIAIWRIYCRLTGDPSCTGGTTFLVVHWDTVAAFVLFPLLLAWLAGWALVALVRLIRRAISHTGRG